MIRRRALESLTKTPFSRFSTTISNPSPSISQNRKRMSLRYLSSCLTSSSSSNPSIFHGILSNGGWLIRKLSTRTRMNESFSNRPPQETILLDGCDFEHWLIVVEKPADHLTRDDIIDGYIKTLAQVLGSEDEARKQIYSVSTRCYFAFGCTVPEDVSYKIKELPHVRWVLPDSYLDVRNKNYGGEPFIEGKAVPYDPKYHEEWVRNYEKSQTRTKDRRPRNENRPRDRPWMNRGNPPPTPPSSSSPSSPNGDFRSQSGLNQSVPPTGNQEISPSMQQQPPQLENRNFQNRDAPPPMQNQGFQNDYVQHPSQNRDFQNRGMQSPMGNQEFQRTYGPPPAENWNNQSRQMPPTSQSQDGPSRGIAPPTQNWNYQSRDVPPTQNRDFQSGDMEPVMNNQGFQNSGMPPQMNNQGFQNQGMPPQINNQGFQNQAMPPQMNNQGFQNRQMLPLMNNQGFQSRDMPPQMNNQSFQTRDIPPPTNNQGFQNNGTPPPIQNRDFQSRDMPPAVQNRDFQYRDMNSGPNRDYQNPDISTGGPTSGRFPNSGGMGMGNVYNRDYQGRDMPSGMSIGNVQGKDQNGWDTTNNRTMGNMPVSDYQAREMAESEYEYVPNK